MGKRTSVTVAQMRKLDSSLHNRVLRVRRSLLTIIQVSIAAGLAFLIAQKLFGHSVPFFAPMAAVITLGLSGGARLRRAFELTLGCSLGVALGDLLILTIGTGHWQIALAVGASLLVARFLSSSQLVSNQIAIGSILIATIMPPGSAGAFERPVDALIGGTMAILVIALLPNSPLSAGRREVSKVLSIAGSVLEDTATALASGNPGTIEAALTHVRGSQKNINAMLDAAKDSKENVAVSPLLWAARGRVQSFVRILAPVDNVIRNTRVLARRAQVLIQDGDKVSEPQVYIITELSQVAYRLSALYQAGHEISEAQEIPELVAHLRRLAAQAGLDVSEGRVLSAQVILAQSRSIIVDLLQVCGMSRESAVAQLVPTSTSPAFPPENPTDQAQ